jgi:aspartyl-tRNA(Asn)/glutamyl-tRNA(Gln) amidotransferase subunit A
MPDADPTRLTLEDAGELIRTRKLSPVELTRAVLARIDALDPSLNVFTTRVPSDDVLAAARVAEADIQRGAHRGPLHGIPVSVKDLIDTAGVRTTYGSGMFRDHVPERDGAVPERLKAAGAVITGKSATHELGQGITTNNHFYGPTLNPWNHAHAPGGSSGGAGAATAARLGPLHVGTDGAGSVRIPAAFCGVVGHKPTIGLLSNRGQFGDGNVSYSVPGPLARTVRDAAVASQALAGYDPGYIYSRPDPAPDLLRHIEDGVRGLRIGTSADLLVPAPSDDVRAAHDATLRRLERLGAGIVQVEMPHHLLVLGIVAVAFGVEGEVHLEQLIGNRPHVFGPHVSRLRGLTAAHPVDVPTAVRVEHDRQRLRRDYAVAFSRVDALVVPTSPQPAPRIDADESSHPNVYVPYTGAANLVGVPAVAIPAGISDGLPIGMQVIAGIGNDALALRIARALERDDVVHRVVEPPAS